MALDKNTFGDSPAAIYLVHQLNSIDNKKMIRKVASNLTTIHRIINDIVHCQIFDRVSMQTVNFVAASLREKANDLHEYFVTTYPEHPVIGNLVKNLIVGEIKTIIRKSRKIKNLTKSQRRITSAVEKSDGMDINNIKLPNNVNHESNITDNSIAFYNKKDGVKLAIWNPGTTYTLDRHISLNDVSDSVDNELLINRSKKKLARLNKPDTLY